MKLERLHDHKLPTGVLAFSASANGRRVYAACMDGKLYDVDVETGERTPFNEGHASYASGVVLLPDQKTLVSAGYDGALRWHDIETRQCYRVVQAHAFWSWELALSPDGKRLASVTGQYLSGGLKYEPAAADAPTVKVYDSRTGDLLHRWEHLPPVQSVSFSPDNRHLAAANMMGEVRVWDLTKNDAEPVATWRSEDFTSWGTTKSHHYCGGIHGLAFSPDGEALIACGMGPMGDPMAGNGKMTWQRWAWKASPARLVDQIHDGEHGSGLMEALAWHPSGKTFVMAGRQAQGTWNAAVFNSDDGKLTDSIDTKKRITQAAFAPSGERLFLAGVQGQPKCDDKGNWPDYGRLQIYSVA